MIDSRRKEKARIEAEKARKKAAKKRRQKSKGRNNQGVEEDAQRSVDAAGSQVGLSLDCVGSEVTVKLQDEYFYKKPVAQSEVAISSPLKGAMPASVPAKCSSSVPLLGSSKSPCSRLAGGLPDSEAGSTVPELNHLLSAATGVAVAASAVAPSVEM